MKKNIFVFSLVLIYINFNYNMAFGTTLPPADSGSITLNSTGIMTGVNAGKNASFGSQNAARCSPKRFMNCVKAAAGFAQVVSSLMQMLNTMKSRDDLSPGTDWSMPNFGSNFGAVDPADSAYIDPIIRAAEAGDVVAYEQAQQQLLEKLKPDIDKLEKMGFTIDPLTGEVKTPPGSPSLASAGVGGGLGGRLDAYDAQAMNALNASGQGDGSGSGPGNLFGKANSAGGAGGGSAAGGSFDGFDGGRGISSLGSGSGVDQFLNKLDKGDLNGDKLVGMSKNTKDGDAIGVAMGNLFKMVHVKYKSLNTKNEFK